MIEAGESSQSTVVKKRIKILPIEDVCIICNAQNYDLKPFQENHSQNEKKKSYINVIFKCFNIHLLNPEYDIRNTKVCWTCITRMREALSFRKVVREAQQRIQNKIDVLLNNYSHSIEDKVPSKEQAKSHTKYSEPLETDPNLPDDTLDNDDTENVLIYSSDGESSTTSEQMRIATGYKELDYEFTPEPSLPLDKSCRACPVCSKTFETFRSLDLHHQTHFIKHVCHLCGMSYAKKSSYMKHMRRHDGIIYSCTQCEKKYFDEYGVTHHVRTFHSKEKIYACKECDKKFCTYASRSKHIYYNHPNIPVKTYHCPVCDRMFINSAHMKNHKANIHDKLLKFSCDECSYTATNKLSLKNHMIKHTDVKNHVCNVCGKAYARSNTLREHLKIHYNIRKFKCKICEKAFVQNCSLKGHIKTHHKNYVNCDKEESVT